MIEKKIRALRDGDLNTRLGFHTAIAGEVFSFTFKDRVELEAILGLGCFELVPDDTPEGKEIPVIPSEDDMILDLDLTGNLD